MIQLSFLGSGINRGGDEQHDEIECEFYRIHSVISPMTGLSRYRSCPEANRYTKETRLLGQAPGSLVSTSLVYHGAVFQLLTHLFDLGLNRVKIKRGWSLLRWKLDEGLSQLSYLLLYEYKTPELMRPPVHHG